MNLINFQNNQTKLNKATFDEFQNNIKEAIDAESSKIDSMKKNGTSILDNPLTEKSITQNTKILSRSINIKTGKIFIIATVCLMHDGGTPNIAFLVDGTTKASFFASKLDSLYTFSTVVENLVEGQHTIDLQINPGNVSNLKVPAYTATNLTVVEI